MDGEDIVQEALFHAYRKLDSFDESREFATFGRSFLVLARWHSPGCAPGRRDIKPSHADDGRSANTNSPAVTKRAPIKPGSPAMP